MSTASYGDPGIGKSLFLADLAARVSRGGAMPDGTAEELLAPWAADEHSLFNDAYRLLGEARRYDNVMFTRSISVSLALTAAAATAARSYRRPRRWRSARPE